MKCSKEKYIYSHEPMYLSVIKQKQTISFFVTSCVLHNINKNKLFLFLLHLVSYTIQTKTNYFFLNKLHLLYFNQQTLTLLYVSIVFKMVSWLTLATPSINT